MGQREWDRIMKSSCQTECRPRLASAQAGSRRKCGRLRPASASTRSKVEAMRGKRRSSGADGSRRSLETDEVDREIVGFDGRQFGRCRQRRDANDHGAGQRRPHAARRTAAALGLGQIAARQHRVGRSSGLNLVADVMQGLCAGLVPVRSCVVMKVLVDRSRDHLGQHRRRSVRPVVARSACRHADRGPSFEGHGDQQQASQQKSPDGRVHARVYSIGDWPAALGRQLPRACLEGMAGTLGCAARQAANGRMTNSSSRALDGPGTIGA